MHKYIPLCLPMIGKIPISHGKIPISLSAWDPSGGLS